MNSVPRYLTKSRFKTGSECATKLYYLDKSEYGNKKADDTFLKALAEGGFQVGELAKLYHPGGIEVREASSDLALARTEALLKQENVILFEAAIRYGNLFVRVDVLRKNGHFIELIEVKAKSFDGGAEEDSFFTKRGKKRSIRSEWRTYLLDIAFQTSVAKKAFPDFKVTSFLMLADKSKNASVDGLNQKFFIERDGKGRSKVSVKGGTTAKDLGERILCKVNVHEAVEFLIEEEVYPEGKFEAHVAALADLAVAGKKGPPNISSKCKSCEYRIDPAKFPSGTKSGFAECFSDAIQMHPSDALRPMVFDIWNFRKSQALLDAGCYYMDQVSEADISVKESDRPGLSSSQRQMIQVEKVRNKDSKPYLDLEGLRMEFASWVYPLHFIDFETVMVALPFHSGRRPYEQIAFQFSHHMVHADGKVEHKTQYLHRKRGDFPNFAFVRSLKSALENDDGTIFRYSHHENSVLCQIVHQLERSEEDDAKELIAWIKTITTAKDDDDKQAGWVGIRSMLDLCELVKRYHYSPSTNGSNSIKKVLPAVLEESDYLATRYSKAVYGSQADVTSLNFKDWAWLQREQNGNVKDPYRLLPPIFSEEETEAIERIVNADEIAGGGTAMMAFAMMQFTEMSDAEAKKVQDSLLKYCELDTFAMVMIFEHWKNLIDAARKNKAA